jgi:hypothetical protein
VVHLSTLTYHGEEFQGGREESLNREEKSGRKMVYKQNSKVIILKSETMLKMKPDVHVEHTDSNRLPLATQPLTESSSDSEVFPTGRIL